MFARRRAFSLIELVVVIVILGIIATIALPRIGRTAVGASESGLRQDLAIMRSAIESYRAEHRGSLPTLANMPNALLQFSDLQGTLSPTQTATAIYGPYLTQIPPQKVGENAGLATFGAPAATNTGWTYDEATGELRANATGADASGTNYADY
ncbi:MAG: prepilin-type N-terminal cleavage/methylation domain-containing protein [Planctomycetota bacterium]